MPRDEKMRRVTLQLEPSLYEELSKQADHNRRTLPQEIIYIVERMRWYRELERQAVIEAVKHHEQKRESETDVS